MIAKGRILSISQIERTTKFETDRLTVTNQRKQQNRVTKQFSSKQVP